MASQDDLGFEEEAQPGQIAHPEESVQQDNTKVPSASKSALIGAEQGTTLGFADELAGLAQAAPDKLMALLNEYGLSKQKSPTQVSKELADQGVTGDVGPTSTEGLYKQGRNEAREELKAAQEAHPVATFAGELGGGMLVPMGALGKTLKPTAAIGEKILQGMKVGAVGGGIAGVGTSEAESVPELAGAGLKGVATGGVLGAGIPAAAGGIRQIGRGISYLGKEAADLPIVQDLLEAYRRTKAGQEIAGVKAREAIGKEMTDFAEELPGQIKEKALKPAGQEKERALENQVVNKDLMKRLGELRAKAEKLPEEVPEQVAEKKRIIDYLDNAMNGKPKEVTTVVPGETVPSGEEKTVSKLQELIAQRKAQKEMGQPEAQAEQKIKERFAQREATAEEQTKPFTETEQVPTSAGPEVKRAIGPGGEQMAEVIKDIQPGEVKVLTDPDTGQQVAAFMDEATGKVTTKVIPEEYAYTPIKFVKELQRQPEPITPEKVDLMKGVFRGFKEGSAQEPLLNEAHRLSAEATRTIDDLAKEAIPALESANSKYSAGKRALEVLGINEYSDIREAVPKITQLLQRIESGSRSSDTAKKFIDQFGKELEIANPKLAEELVPKMRDMATRFDLAEKSTRTGLVGPLSIRSGPVWAGKTAGAMVKSIQDGTPQEVLQMAGKLSEVGTDAAKNLSKIMAGMANRDSRGRQAMIFSIMQNPKYRELLGASKDGDSSQFNYEGKEEQTPVEGFEEEPQE